MTTLSLSSPRHSVLPTTVVAAELAAIFIGATLPTPLYPLYGKEFGFGEVTLTLIYAVYVLGNVGALFLGGRLSDQIGRRRASLPAIGFGAAATLVFLFASGTASLFVGRVLTGLATGLGAGAATAWIAELQPAGSKQAAAAIATAANFVGLAIGCVGAGLLAGYAPWPLRLSWAVYLSVLAAIAVPTLFTRETVEHRASRLGDLSLRPRLGVPRDIRLEFLSPAVCAFATFAVLGFYSALTPGLLSEALHEPSPVVSGLIVAELYAVAALAAVATAGLPSRTGMLAGLTLLLPSLALLVGAELMRSMPLLILSAGLTGAAAALGYRGSLAVVNAIAPADRRGEIVSSYLIAVYAGNALPVIGVGVLAGLTGRFVAHAIFAALIAALAVLALATGVKYAPPN